MTAKAEAIFSIFSIFSVKRVFLLRNGDFTLYFMGIGGYFRRIRVSLGGMIFLLVLELTELWEPEFFKIPYLFLFALK